MKLKVIGSGSKGNCYLLHNDDEAIIIECGCQFSKVREEIRGLGLKIVGTLVSHEHADHAKYVKQWLEHGLDVYASKGTIEAIGDVSRISKMSVVEDGHWINVGSFQVLPFLTIHDAAEPYGFVIIHQESGPILFATDTSYIPHSFSYLNQVMIECNYDEDLLAAREDIPESLKQRIRENHMSVDQCVDEMHMDCMSDVRNIVLIHLSEGDGDPISFRSKIEAETGKNVTVASPGVEIELSKFPF